MPETRTVITQPEIEELKRLLEKADTPEGRYAICIHLIDVPGSLPGLLAMLDEAVELIKQEKHGDKGAQYARQCQAFLDKYGVKSDE